MFLRTVEIAFARYQAKGEAAALAIVFDRTAPELLRLARHLAHDVTQAEDLVQATFLTAMESPSSHESGRPVLPWLCGILANHARSTRRQARRKPEPSRLRGDNVQDVHEEALALELHEEVREAVAQLPEVYRPVIRLWLEHGLEAHEIAATLERPAGTVRAQVTRGMEQLRRILPAGLAGATAIAVGTGQGLAAVRKEVLAACSGTSSGLVSTLALGGLMMLHHKLLAAIAAMFLGLLTWFVWPAPEASPELLAAANGSAPPLAEAAAGDQESPAATSEPNNEERQAAPVPNVAEPAIAKPAPDTVLVVVLRDKQSGDALPGYAIALRSRDSLQQFGNLPNYQRTNQRGEARFENASPGETWIELGRQGHIAVIDVPVAKTTRHQVDLEPTGTISGTVRGPDGQPVAAASVLIINNSMRPPVLTTTDLAGRFTIAHARALTIQARHPSFVPSLATPAKATPGSDTLLDLTLGVAGRAIRGVVRRHSGEALPHASIAVMPASARKIHPYSQDKPKQMALWVRTDAEGRFETTEIAPDEYLVFVVPREQDLTPTSASVNTADHDGFVELRLLEPTVVTGRIVQDGKVATDVRITVFPEQPTHDVGYLLNLAGLRTCTLNEDGTFHITGVIPGRLCIRAMRGMQTIAETRMDLAAGQTIDWQPSLAANRQLRLQVRCDAELPPNLFAMIYNGVDGAAPVMAPIDKNGNTSADIAATGGLQIKLVIMKDGRNLTCLATFDDVQPSTNELQFELRAAQLPVGTIRGRLIDDVQAPVTATTISIMRLNKPGLFVMQEVTTKADGTFSLGPVPAGVYSLRTGPITKPNLLRTVTVTSAGDEDLGDVKQGDAND